MSIKNDINTFLETLTDFQTLLGTGKIMSPDGELTESNGVIYRMMSDPKTNDTNLRKSAQRKWQLWRFYINQPDTDKINCQAMADELELQMHEYSGTLGSVYANYIFMDSNMSPFLLDDISTYQIIQDYRFTIL